MQRKNRTKKELQNWVKALLDLVENPSEVAPRIDWNQFAGPRKASEAALADKNEDEDADLEEQSPRKLREDLGTELDNQIFLASFLVRQCFVKVLNDVNKISQYADQADLNHLYDAVMPKVIKAMNKPTEDNLKALDSLAKRVRYKSFRLSGSLEMLKGAICCLLGIGGAIISLGFLAVGVSSFVSPDPALTRVGGAISLLAGTFMLQGVKDLTVYGWKKMQDGAGLFFAPVVPARSIVNLRSALTSPNARADEDLSSSESQPQSQPQSPHPQSMLFSSHPDSLGFEGPAGPALSSYGGPAGASSASDAANSNSSSNLAPLLPGLMPPPGAASRGGRLLGPGEPVRSFPPVKATPGVILTKGQDTFHGRGASPSAPNVAATSSAEPLRITGTSPLPSEAATQAQAATPLRAEGGSPPRPGRRV